MKSRRICLEACTRDIDKTTLQQPQKGFALCPDATLGIKAHRWVPARTPTVHRCPSGKAVGGPTARSTVRQTCTTKRQTPLSLTTYMVAEPCSVPSAQPGSSSKQNVDELDKKLTDSTWAVASNRDREHKETRLILVTRQATQVKRFKSEKFIDQVQNESSCISWKTNSAQLRTRVTHHQHSRGGKARHHSRAGRSRSTDRKCNVGLVMNQQRTIVKLFQIIMKTAQKESVHPEK